MKLHEPARMLLVADAILDVVSEAVEGGYMAPELRYAMAQQVLDKLEAAGALAPDAFELPARPDLQPPLVYTPWDEMAKRSFPDHPLPALVGRELVIPLAEQHRHTEPHAHDAHPEMYQVGYIRPEKPWLSPGYWGRLGRGHLYPGIDFEGPSDPRLAPVRVEPGYGRWHWRSLLCDILMHDWTRWVDALWTDEELRGCLTCERHEYRSKEAALEGLL